MANIETNSLYTSGIVELEEAADMVEIVSKDEPDTVRTFANNIADVLRERADQLREHERTDQEGR
jgi:hypothetical protein